MVDCGEELVRQLFFSAIGNDILSPPLPAYTCPPRAFTPSATATLIGYAVDMGNITAEVEVIDIESDDDDLEVTTYLGTGTNYSMYYLNLGVYATELTMASQIEHQPP